MQEPKILNFQDAIQLASIISPYILDESILSLDMKEFSTKIVELLSVDDLYRVVTLISGKSPSLDESKNGMYMLQVIILGFMVNRIQSLIQVYRESLEIKQ